jgi:hypothetical protein
MSQYDTEEYPRGKVQKTTRQQHVSRVTEERSLAGHSRRNHHINVRWNVHVDRLSLIGFGSISNANNPDELGFDVPQSEITFYDELPGRRWYDHVNGNRFDAGEHSSLGLKVLNLYPGVIV